MKVSFVIDWKFVLAGLAGTAAVIAVAKMSSEDLSKATSSLASAVCDKARIERKAR